VSTRRNRRKRDSRSRTRSNTRCQQSIQTHTCTEGNPSTDRRGMRVRDTHAGADIIRTGPSRRCTARSRARRRRVDRDSRSRTEVHRSSSRSRKTRRIRMRPGILPVRAIATRTGTVTDTARRAKRTRRECPGHWNRQDIASSSRHSPGRTAGARVVTVRHRRSSPEAWKT
jgi:hypothetical protein